MSCYPITRNPSYILFRLSSLPAFSKSILMWTEQCQLLRSSLVSRHTRLKGRIVESAGIRSYRERSGPDRWHNRPWNGWGGGRQDTDPLPALGTTCSLDSYTV